MGQVYHAAGVAHGIFIALNNLFQVQSLRLHTARVWDLPAALCFTCLG